MPGGGKARGSWARLRVPWAAAREEDWEGGIYGAGWKEEAAGAKKARWVVVVDIRAPLTSFTWQFQFVESGVDTVRVRHVDAYYSFIYNSSEMYLYVLLVSLVVFLFYGLRLPCYHRHSAQWRHGSQHPQPAHQSSVSSHPTFTHFSFPSTRIQMLPENSSPPPAMAGPANRCVASLGCSESTIIPSPL